MKHRRRYSLRRHVWVVVALIALIPVLFVTLGVQFDYVIRHLHEEQVVTAVQACGDAIENGESCVPVADANNVWIRVFRNGQLVEERDSASDASASWIEHMMSLDAETWLRKHDPIAGRSFSQLPAGICEVAYDRLMVCHGGRTIERGADSFTVVAVTGDVRSVRALSFDGVTKLALQILIVALLVGWWLGRRIVKPMERLRDRVLDRRGRRDFEPIPTEDETEVSEIAGAFNELLAEVDEKRRANQAFAADLAHDLKTPISTILSCAENIEDADGLTADQARRHASVLRRNGERLNQVVGEFLDLARAEAGLREDPRERIDIEALLEAILSQLDTEHTIELKSQPASVAGSPRYLQTALTNVIMNALQVGETDAKVEVEVDRQADEVVVEVRDDGPGVAPEDLPRVFERFFTRRRGGTGLGLPMARAVARAHGGDLTVRSELKEGAVFEFRLPSYESHTQIIDE